MESPADGGFFPCGLGQPVDARPQICVASTDLFQICASARSGEINRHFEAFLGSKRDVPKVLLMPFSRTIACRVWSARREKFRAGPADGFRRQKALFAVGIG